LPVPTAAGQIRLQGNLPDKDEDGVSDGQLWQVLGTYHLSDPPPINESSRKG
jgi:hypothetical protein